jgi:uncharacterized protein (DUF2147 family)
MLKSAKLFFLFYFSCLTVFSQKTESEKIIGTWLNGTGEAKIEIFKTGDKFYGSIIWLKNPNDNSGNPKLDKNNPDQGKRSKPILGLLILRGFEYQGENSWEKGKIYDPKNGKDYSCNLSLEGNKLNVRGYIGISLIGRTDIWTRVQ